MNPSAAILNVFLSLEHLKKLDKISSYNVSAEETNFRISMDGELNSDLKIKTTIIPKRTLKSIDLKFKILPSNGEEESRID